MDKVFDCRFTEIELRTIVEALRLAAQDAARIGINKDYNTFRDLASQIQANVLEQTV